MPDSTTPMETWTRVASRDELTARGRLRVKLDGRQIALFAGDGDDVWACDNRCPHEGYPLVEGTLTDGCILTCNWHNWKFDLKGGETLVGGDTLRRYPVRLDGDDILLDLAEPDPAEIAAKALDGLHDCFDDHDYARIAREIARLQAAGGDPLDALRRTIVWTHDRFQYGATHAVAAAADWLVLRDAHADDPARALTAIVECVGYFAWDSRLAPSYPFPAGLAPYDADALVAAIEAEDEAAAVALVRGAADAGLDYADVAPALARATLAHYQDFGHAAIYLYKTGQLVQRLGGAEVLEPLLLMMVRSLVYASREDLIPEFRACAPKLAGWDGKADAVPAPEDLRTVTVAGILEKIAAGAAHPEAVYDAAMAAAAW
ncbi:MAG: Rieske (2Fe-2S) protein [Rhodospirillaceae bacterium]